VQYFWQRLIFGVGYLTCGKPWGDTRFYDHDYHGRIHLADGLGYDCIFMALGWQNQDIGQLYVQECHAMDYGLVCADRSDRHL
jgi:hypothetical protein